jgi:hypothetical protein
VETESALLLVCPGAGPAVSAARARLDSSARAGVPAHVTVLYPFRPVGLLGADDHHALEDAYAGVDAFTLRASGTAWFGDRVLYVAPDDPAPVLAVVEATVAAMPGAAPYGGAFAEVVPHLTVGHGHDVEVLRAAGRQVAEALPFTQHLDHVELWAGPALAGVVPEGSWHHVRSYPLRAPTPRSAPAP